MENGDLFSRELKRVLFKEANKSNLIYSHAVSDS
jgi:sRNA-binding regulator protein Hfq